MPNCMPVLQPGMQPALCSLTKNHQDLCRFVYYSDHVHTINAVHHLKKKQIRFSKSIFLYYLLSSTAGASFYEGVPSIAPQCVCLNT